MVLFLHISSRVADEPYPRLLRDKGGSGFPTLLFMDAAGDVLLKQRGRDVEAFTTSLERLERWRELERLRASGDPGIAYELLMAEIDLGRVDFPAAAAQRQTFGELDPEQERALDAQLTNLESEHLIKKKGPHAGPDLLQMWEAGRIPTGAAGRGFYDALLDHAADQKDAKQFVRFLSEMKRAYGKERRLRPYFKERQEQVRDLRRGN
ncbi:MAG: hypothetical protein AAF628_01080 [Planctomycetota bacterium]